MPGHDRCDRHSPRSRWPGLSRTRRLRAVAGQAPLAGRPCAHRQARGGAAAGLRVRRGAASSAPTARRPRCSARRRAGFERLAALFARASRSARGHRARRARASPTCSSPARYRVPFQYSRYLRQHLQVGASLRASQGVTVDDLDGNVFHDLTGSYGVNVFGHDFYKACIDEGVAQARALGPVLGAYHPCVLDNVERLRAISGLDEVSFHMSGTEAVMQAVRLARYHTRRIAPGALLRRLPRLVGGRAARPRQPAAGARDLHAEGHGRARAARAAHAARHRLRAGQPAAGAAPERRAPGDSRWSTARAAPASTAPPTPPGCRQLREVCTAARHRADLRRGVRRLPPGAGRRAGVLRRARRHGDLRQDAGRRPAGRRRVRPRAT